MTWKLNGSTLSDSAATTLTSTGTYGSTGSYSWDVVVADSAAAAAPGPGPPGGLALRFESLDAAARGAAGGEAYLDFGTVSADPAGRAAAIVIRRRIALRIEGTGAPGSVRVSVALAGETPGYTVRVDGVVLSTLPRTIDPVHRVGAPVVHEIEVTIAASAPAGAFLSDLEWLVESD